MMSKIDAMIEQAVFGSSAPRNVPTLGVYLAPDVVYLSETRPGGAGGVTVSNLVRIPLPAGDGKTASGAGTMSSDFLADPQKVAAVIRQSMSQLRWNATHARVTLSHHLGLLRYFTMPAVDKRFLRSAVPIEAKKYIPIPFELLAHDFETMPLPPDAAGKPRVGVLVAVTQRKNVAAVQGLLDALGLKLAGLEVAPCSVFRLWQAVAPGKTGEAYAQVHIDGGSVRIMICDQGVPIFFREVFLGGDATAEDLRKIDLPGCLSFVQKQLGITSVRTLRISGGGPSAELFRASFAQETGLPAAIQDTPKLLNIKSGDWGGYASLGSSMNSASAAQSLNLAAGERVSEDEVRVARNVVLAGFLVSVFLCGAGLVKSAMHGYQMRELNDYQIAPEIEAAIGSLPGPAIEERLRDMQSQLERLSMLSDTSRPKASAVLRTVIEAMPEKVWLSNITLNNSLMNADKLPYEITLRGHAQDRSVSEEQTLVFQFQDALRASALGKSFEIQVSIQKQGNIGDPSAGLDPETLAARLSERTRFDLTMRSKR